MPENHPFDEKQINLKIKLLSVNENKVRVKFHEGFLHDKEYDLSPEMFAHLVGSCNERTYTFDPRKHAHFAEDLAEWKSLAETAGLSDDADALDEILSLYDAAKKKHAAGPPI